MFHPWEKDVSNLLKSGKNELKVVFHSPTKKVLPIMKQKKYKLPADNDQAGDTSPYTRKAPYHYGWDWGPCFCYFRSLERCDTPWVGLLVRDALLSIN